MRHDSAAAGPRLGWHEAIAATVTGLGYELVEVERAPRGLLRVYIDRVPGRAYRGAGGVADSGEFVTVDDCEQVTRQLQYALEVEGLDYARLEVSSPGLDRPLKKADDFIRFAGEEAELRLANPIDNARKLKGVLRGCTDGAVALETAKGIVTIPLAEINRARLVPRIEWR